jgi:hypothetical protein
MSAAMQCGEIAGLRPGHRVVASVMFGADWERRQGERYPDESPHDEDWVVGAAVRRATDAEPTGGRMKVLPGLADSRTWIQDRTGSRWESG